MTDAELIEKARESVSRLMNYGECHDGDVDSAACLLEQLASRVEELTAEDPWRPASDEPNNYEESFVKMANGDIAMGFATACRGWRSLDGCELKDVTHWKLMRWPKP